MDVKPQQSNGKTVVLLHGKNFNGAYWRTTINALIKDGYMVIVPDQIGFGKSSKPVGCRFSIQQLALNTKAVLDQLGISKIYLLGHSMGGRIAVWFTSMYPDWSIDWYWKTRWGWRIGNAWAYTPFDSNYQKEMKRTSL